MDETIDTPVPLLTVLCLEKGRRNRVKVNGSVAHWRGLDSLSADTYLAHVQRKNASRADGLLFENPARDVP